MATPDTAMNLLKNVRKYIFEHFEEHAIAPVLEQIMQKFELDRTSAFNALVDLQSPRHVALLPGTQRIQMAFSFLAILTLKGVTMLEKGKAIRILCVPGSSAMCRADWRSTSALNADVLSNSNFCMICSRTGAIACSSKCSKMYFLTFFSRFIAVSGVAMWGRLGYNSLG